MRSESLEYFLEIASCGSFTNAAKKLYVSQQGLSKAIKALEKDLGCRLFQREGSHLALSAAGRALVPFARRCLDDVEMLREAMEPFSQMSTPGRASKRERLTIYASSFVADSLFFLLDEDIRRSHLNNVRIIERPCDEMIEELRTRPKPCPYALCLPIEDVGLLADVPDVEFRPLFATEILLVGSSQFIHPEKGAFSLDKVAKMPLVYYNDPVLNRIIGDMFAGRVLENVITHAASTSRISKYILQGKAVTFSDSLSRFLTEEDGDVAYASIENTSRFVVGFAFATGDEGSVRTRDYVDGFEACFRTRCAPYLEENPLPVL